MKNVVVIGAGQAGCSVVTRLRGNGFDGSITLIGEEPVVPYQRPPLSKQYLQGEMERPRLFLRPEKYYFDNNIDIRLNQTVTAVDRDNRTVRCGEDTHSYTDLVLATGAKPHRLPRAIGGELQNVFCVRTLKDIDQMKPAFCPGARLLVIGGGYIGLEAAAVAAKTGLKVTLVEMAERILQRVAAKESSDYFRSLHKGHGVDIREGVGVTRLLGDTQVTGALLSDGSELEADFVISGIGVAPATKLAEDAGLAIENGVRVDEFGRTSDANIWAAGDCASFPYQGSRVRLESVPNAIDQSECVADNVMGAEKEYEAKPWFWSDQYDVKLQIAGLNQGYDRVVSRTTDNVSKSFWYYQGERLLAVDALNAPRDYMVAKRLIESGKSPVPELVSNVETNLKALLQT